MVKKIDFLPYLYYFYKYNLKKQLMSSTDLTIISSKDIVRGPVKKDNKSNWAIKKIRHCVNDIKSFFQDEHRPKTPRAMRKYLGNEYYITDAKTSGKALAIAEIFAENFAQKYIKKSVDKTVIFSNPENPEKSYFLPRENQVLRAKIGDKEVLVSTIMDDRNINFIGFSLADPSKLLMNHSDTNYDSFKTLLNSTLSIKDTSSNTRLSLTDIKLESKPKRFFIF